VNRLILTHFSTRYRDVAPLVEEARGVFANTEAAADFAEFNV
jgi:ribonuclease Z